MIFVFQTLQFNMSSNIAEKTTEDVASNPDIEKFSGFAICTTHLHSIFPN